VSKTERVLLILERLSSGAGAASHAELMRELGVQRSTLSDSLAELRELGYVTTRERQFLPGPRLLTFVHRAAANGRLIDGVRPTLEALAAATGETAVYVMENEGRGDLPTTVVAMDQVESRHSIRYVADIGEPWPVDSTAAGRVFLAFSDAQSLARKVPGVDLVPLSAELARIRACGYAVVGDLARSSAVAAAVTDSHGNVIGALSVVGPTERMPDAASLWPQLRDAVVALGGSRTDDSRPAPNAAA
jgi:DNA-binding IclR family transcriptional regulator